MSKQPERRYATCRDLITASRGALEPGATDAIALEFDDPPTDPRSAGLLGDGRTAPLSAGLLGDRRTDPLSAEILVEPEASSRKAGATPAPPPRKRPTNRIRATGQGGRRRLVGGGVAALLVIAAVLAILALTRGGGSGDRSAGRSRGVASARASAGGASPSGGMSGGGSTSKQGSGGNSMPATKMPASNAISQALRVTNKSRTAKGLLPPASCMAQGKSTVTCTTPAFGATSVTFRTYPSLGALYGAYLSAIRGVAPGRFHSNFGDCTERQTDGEVSWNHDYEHPRHYSLQQARNGRLSDDQAAGRVFCTFSNSTLHIIWTQNDGRLLGILSGAPHANTWDWWKGVHHSIDLPGSSSNMSMSS